jgi:hypothetical protein
MKRVFVLVLVLFSCLAPGQASGDEIAPELLTLELRNRAHAELRALVATLSDGERRRLVGLYLAFDPTPSDAIAQVACDDDGDWVIVLSDAMLRLADDVARAASDDEANGTHRVDDHATFLATAQVPGKRVLPPPPGFFSSPPGASHDDRLREALAFLLAHEVERLRAGDLVCPNPTATKEHGDDEWTPAEQARARETARSVYPAQGALRDAMAAGRVARAGRGDKGALALARFFAAVSDRPRFSYRRDHPRPLT